MATRLLVIDGEASSADWICQLLASHGFVPQRVDPGEVVARIAGGAEPRPVAAVLDLSPRTTDEQSARIIRTLRGWVEALPVVVLSGLGHADERVRMRRAGADAVLTKPVIGVDLVMRLRALLEPGTGVTLRCGDLTLEPRSGRAERAGRQIELTSRERALLELLLRHRGEVVPRNLLLEALWDYRFDPHGRLVDTHVSRLRRKIDDGFPRPLLHTRRRVGYKLSENP